MDREDVIHIYNGILLRHLKEWNNTICSNIDIWIVILSEVNQISRNTIWHRILNTHTHTHTHDTNELTYKKETDSQLRKRTYGCRWEGWREGIVRAFRMDMCTLPYLKRIMNKDLLYSTWISAQCYVAAWMWGQSGGEWIMYMYGWVLSLLTWNHHNIVNYLHSVTK